MVAGALVVCVGGSGGPVVPEAEWLPEAGSLPEPAWSLVMSVARPIVYVV